MPKVMRTCRTCGKQYEECAVPNWSGKFRWKDVACSEECGMEYLRRIMESRNELPAEKSENKTD